MVDNNIIIDSLRKKSFELYNESISIINSDVPNITEAIKILNEAYKINNNDIEIMNLLGVCYYKKCEFKIAKELWNKSKEKIYEGNDAIYYLNNINNGVIKKYDEALSNIYKGNTEKAIILLEDIVKEENGLIEPYIIMSLLYMKLNNTSKAREHILIAKRMDSGDSLVLKYYEFIQNVNKKKNKRIISMVVGLVIVVTITNLYVISKIKNENSKLNDLSNYQMAQIESMGNKIEKVDIYKNTIENDKINLEKKINSNYYGKDEFELLTIANGLYFKGQYNKATDIYKYLVDNCPDNNIVEEAVYFLAISYESIGEYDFAANLYKHYIEKYKNNNYYDDALYNLINILFKANNKDESKFYAKILNEECKNSMFNNEKIEYILNQ